MVNLRNQMQGIVPYFLAGLAIIVVWQGAIEILNPSAAILPTPGATASTLWTLIATGELFTHVFASLSRVLSAWALAAIIAIPLGLIQGSNRRFESVFDPVVELFRPISPLAWIPLAILWFGIGESGKIFIIFIATFFPILLNTVSGVKAVDPVMIRAGRILGCDTSLKLFLKVILPAAMPTILVGLRIAFGTGWAAIIAAELVAAQEGLGFLISDGMEILRSDLVLAGMVVIGILGVMIDSVFRLIGRKVNWGAQ
ncbi:ABC transporter permease [Marinobacter salinus]|uniref:ABC transporter permease n=1 Tax=Marinobacter salinus TaxID=1874317 RepID=A0A1D9GHB0_9GAMM|nr:ABC transporter permease [Marinobacter salinus]AOY86993.1 ABC transporter permease [Marinobacter salinus]